ncbi:beta-eliminating lyase family protein [Desulfovibrio sp. A2]|nr:beta-eliminating lyase family protein [Desulfovibrio sp. A2]
MTPRTDTPATRRIPLIRPTIDDAVKQRVLAVLDSGFLTEGAVTRDFERAVGRFVGAQHAIAVPSCTVGLEIALRAFGIGPGDEVIVPDYTYPATASVVSIVGALPVVVDVDPETMLIDCDALEAAITPRTRAALPVSLFGNPLDYGRLDDIRARHGVRMIEDAACSLGAAQGGRRTGSACDAAVFSFHPRKFITTGEGGMVTTSNPEMAAWMDAYKHFGLTAATPREGATFASMGTNAKLSDILSAVGLAQMDRVDELLARRRALAARYVELLDGMPGVALPRTTPGGTHSYQTFCVFIERRDQVMATMRAQGVEAQIGTYALHRQPAFGNPATCRLSGPMPGSSRAADRCLALPLFHDMTDDDQRHVARTLAAAMRTA